MESCVYLIYNKVNGKLYVGKSCEFNKRWIRHKRVARGGKEKYPKMFSFIHAAMNKYGFDNFAFKIIETHLTEEKSLVGEMKWIKFLRIEGYQLYNLTDGGDGSSGYKHTSEAIEKMRIINSGKGNPCYGRVATLEEREAISLTHRGKKISPEQIAKSANTRKINGTGIGVKNPRAKLTEDLVRQMRNDYPGLSYAKLAKKYGVAVRAAYCIVKKISYRNVD